MIENTKQNKNRHALKSVLSKYNGDYIGKIISDSYIRNAQERVAKKKLAENILLIFEINEIQEGIPEKPMLDYVFRLCYQWAGNIKNELEWNRLLMGMEECIEDEYDKRHQQGYDIQVFNNKRWWKKAVEDIIHLYSPDFQLIEC